MFSGAIASSILSEVSAVVIAGFPQKKIKLNNWMDVARRSGVIGQREVTEDGILFMVKSNARNQEQICNLNKRTLREHILIVDLVETKGFSLMWTMTFAPARPFLTDWPASFGRVFHFLLATRAQLSEISHPVPN